MSESGLEGALEWELTDDGMGSRTARLKEPFSGDKRIPVPCLARS
jgi:hypothetical protein